MSMPTQKKPLGERAQQVVSALERARETIVTAESCTAGALALLLSRAEGAGDVLQGGFITYTKEHKTAALGVSERLLREHGAVTADVVQQMAAGALERSSASLAIAVSGVLGPEEDEDGNPVGLVHFCASKKYGSPRIVCEQFGAHDRERLLQQVLDRALDLIESALRD